MKEIPLTQGKVALVDDADYEWLSQWKWCYATSGRGRQYGYAVRASKNGPLIKMHRFIVGATSDVFVDHKDGDGLNNTRSNIRACTRIQNAQNTTGKRARVGKYKGVYFCAGKHRARICVNKQELYLGGFTSDIDAARAYDAAAKQYFGEFAHLNFPD